MASIAFIGLGNMGGPMAANLVKAGRRVIAFDLVGASRNQAKQDGASIAETAVASVKGADTVVTMLPAGKHVLSVWNEVIPAMTKGALIIDCSTIDVESAKQAHALAAGQGVALGRRAGVGRHRRCQGRDTHLHVRRRGQGVRRGQAGAREDGQEDRALRRRRRRSGGQDLQQHDPGRFHDRGQRGICTRRKTRAVASGAVRCRLDVVGSVLVADSYCPVPGPVPTSPANNDYKPGFASALMVKDLTLAQDAAKAAGAATPLGKHAQEIYRAFDAAGNGGTDFSGIIHHVRALAGK